MPNATRDYGDLRGTGAAGAIDVYHAKSQGDLRPLGSILSSSYIEGKTLTGKRATLLVGNNPDSKGKPAVASPTGYILMWNIKDGGGKFDGSFWRPTAPAGYVSLGDICSEKICVLNDTCRLGPEDKYDVPDWKLAKVLGLPCQKNFANFSSTTPEFTKDNLPTGGDKFGEQDQAELVLPYTAFFPSSDVKSLNLIDDPFISLSKHIAWKVCTTHKNNSAGEISGKTTIKKGVSQTDTNEMSHSAGVNISASYGIGSFSGSISLNYQFTATTTTSFNEYQESTREQGFTVKPY